MESRDEQPRTFALTEDELRRLVAGVVEEVRRTAEPKRSFADRFWDRLSSVSTFVGSVVLGAVALMFNYNYNEQQAAERQAQAEFERQKFVADERDRQRRIILDLSPKILSEKPEDRLGGQAILSHLFPNEAPEIIRDIADEDDPEQREEIAKVIAAAEREAAAAGGWGIIIGHDGSLESAADEVRRAERLGFSAAVYKKGARQWFITVVRGQGQDRDGFASEIDAESANYTVRAQIRGGTQVVNLKEWCQNPQEQSGYTQCSNN